MSHIIFAKLPNAFKRELIHKVDKNYPTINDILDNFSDIVKTLKRTTSYYAKGEVIKKEKSKFKPKESPSALQNFKTGTTALSYNNSKTYMPKPCKFCNSSNHTMFKCDKYDTYDKRLEQCDVLKLCNLCSSPKHLADKCVGNEGKLDFKCFKCKKQTHITALCPSNSDNDSVRSNLCINNSNSMKDNKSILPTYTIQFSSKKSCKVRCLIDTGSERSYISEDVLKELCETSTLSEVTFDVCTFIDEKRRTFKQIGLELKITPSCKIVVPFFVDSEFKIKYEIEGMNTVVENLKASGIKLADTSFNIEKDHSLIHLGALIGADVLQHFPSFYMDNCLYGKGFCINDEIIPFGSITNFLYKNQRKEYYEILDRKNKIDLNNNETQINFVVDPLKSYYNPLDSILKDSQVDNGLEKLFSLESLGIKETDDEICLYDACKVSEFEKNITYEKGKYHIVLPWFDKVKFVPSNYQIALNILKRD